MMRVLHIISGLDVGGAETFLLRLIPHLQNAGLQSSVIYLSGEGQLVSDYRKAGIEVYACRLDHGLGAVVGLCKLFSRVKSEKPDLIQTWMYHADLVGSILGLLFRKRVFWGVRQSNLGAQLNKKSTLFVARICSRISKYLPRSIIYNSEAARVSHESIGYSRSKAEVVHNGIDCKKFIEQPDVGRLIRTELRIPQNALVVGHIGRYDLQKDHATLLKAMPVVRAKLPNVHFVLVGKGITWSNAELFSKFDHAEDSRWLHLLGHRSDIANLLASMDIVCSSSRGESFPNVVLEAMASGIPCVSTNVGDVAKLIGETGIIVQPEAPNALADSCISLLSCPPDDRRELGERARQRVLNHFSIDKTATRFVEIYVASHTDSSFRKALN